MAAWVAGYTKRGNVPGSPATVEKGIEAVVIPNGSYLVAADRTKRLTDTEVTVEDCNRGYFPEADE